MIILIFLILAFFHYILRVIFIGDLNPKLDEEGKYVDLWGKIILFALSFAAIIFISSNSEAIKWFWNIFVLAIFGFQAFIDWKYLKNLKQFIISIIVMVSGVLLVNLIL